MATFKVVRNVTLPVLKITKASPRYVAVLSEMYVGEKIDDKKEAATIVRALDMETGELGLVLCPTILQKELSKNYPEHGYVRKGFQVTVTPVAEKKYNMVGLVEVEIPEEIRASVTDHMEKMRGLPGDPLKKAVEAEPAKASEETPAKASKK